jgi:hypothetical protein
VTLQILRLITMVVTAGFIPKMIGWLDRRSARAQGAVTETTPGPVAAPVAC